MTRKKLNLRLFALEIFMWLLALVVLVPIALIVINSLKTKPEANVMSLSLPQAWQWANYRTVVIEGRMATAFLNSLIITSGSVLVTNVAAAMGAFVLARRGGKLMRWTYLFFVIGLLAPINFIPTIRIMQFFGIMNTYPGIILLYTALMIPFTMFLYYGFVNTVPRDMDEAAVIDGSSAWTLFFRIQVPLMSPVIITGVLISFMNAWNDFILPLYFFNRSSRYPLTLAVYNFYGAYIASWNLVCAAIILTVLPILIVYVTGQKYIVSGMIAGAIKG